MKPTLEIERTFLVDPDLLPPLPPGQPMTQAYLGFAPVVRVRIAGEHAWLTVKGPGLVERVEVEVAIPLAEARHLMELRAEGGRLVEKTRHRLQLGEHLWEVDVFSGELDGLVVAEVELASIDEPVEVPHWAVREVSEDPRYQNMTLAREGLPSEG